MTQNLRSAFLSFGNLLELAHLCDCIGKVYEQQQALVDECRNQQRPFLAVMPLRNQFHCPKCNLILGEAILHFEDPAQIPVPTKQDSMFQKPLGRHFVINRSDLHDILAHDQEAPVGLKALLLPPNA